MVYLAIILILAVTIYLLVTFDRAGRMRDAQQKAGMQVYGKGIAGTDEPVLLVRCNYCGNKDIVIHKEQKVAVCWKCSNHTNNVYFKDVF